MEDNKNTNTESRENKKRNGWGFLMLIIICFLIIAVALIVNGAKWIMNWPVNQETNKQNIVKEKTTPKQIDTWTWIQNVFSWELDEEGMSEAYKREIEEYNKKLEEEERKYFEQERKMREELEKNTPKEIVLEKSPNTYIVFVNNTWNTKILTYLKDLDKLAWNVKQKEKKELKIEINVLNEKPFKIFKNISEFYQKWIFDYTHFTNKKCDGIAYVILDKDYKTIKVWCKKVIPIKNIKKTLFDK